MPPRQKYTREEMIDQALQIVKEKGIDALTARSLGAALHTSSRPIFTAFENMGDIKHHVILRAKELYDQYVRDGLQEENPFKGAGMSYIQFAIEEPKLFQLLFMSEQENVKSLQDVLSLVDDNHNEIRASISPALHLSSEQTARLYEHLWIYTHGMATFCATNVYRFQPEQMDRMLSEMFLGIITRMKEEEK